MTVQKQRKRASAKSEKAVAEALGGRRIPGSGCGLDKADGRVRGKFRIENKITSKSFYRLTAEDWVRLWAAASAAGELPVFHVRMKSSLVGDVEVVVVPVPEWQPPYSAMTKMSIGGPQKGFRIDALSFDTWPHLQQRFSLVGRYQDGTKTFHLTTISYFDFLSTVEAREERDHP